jgi:hypothetical protein
MLWRHSSREVAPHQWSIIPVCISW